MITALGWLSLMAPAIVVMFRELIALWRQRRRRVNLERLIETTRLDNAVHIVDIDRDGAAIHIVVARSPR